MRSRRLAQLSSIFSVEEQKCLLAYSRGNEALESQFCKLLTCSESFEPLTRNRDPNMSQDERVCAVCCLLEVAGDVISGENVKTSMAMPW